MYLRLAWNQAPPASASRVLGLQVCFDLKKKKVQTKVCGNLARSTRQQGGCARAEVLDPVYGPFALTEIKYLLRREGTFVLAGVTPPSLGLSC